MVVMTGDEKGTGSGAWAPHGRLVICTLLLVASCTQSPRAQRPPASETPSTGVIWDSLRRPLSLPVLAPGAPCPRSGRRTVVRGVVPAAGNGPLYAGLALVDTHGVVRYPTYPTSSVGDWIGVKVLWLGPPKFPGPALVRGGRVDGTGTVQFEYGPTQEDLLQGHSEPRILNELQLLADGPSADSSGWYIWGSQVQFRQPGCYALQVDSPASTEIIVFLAAPA